MAGKVEVAVNCTTSVCTQEILGYIGVTLALRPEAKERIAQPATGQEAAGAVATLEAQAMARSLGTVLQLDVAMEAPVIVMPRNSESEDKVRLQCGNKTRSWQIKRQNNILWLIHSAQAAT